MNKIHVDKLLPQLRKYRKEYIHPDDPYNVHFWKSVREVHGLRIDSMYDICYVIDEEKYTFFLMKYS